MISLSDLALKIKGKLHGSDIKVSGVSTPEEQVDGTVCVIADKKRLPLTSGKAAAYVIPENIYSESLNKPVITVNSSRHAVVELINIFYPQASHGYSIAKQSFIDPTALVDDQVYIGPFVTVGAKSSVAKECVIEAGVSIGRNVHIGKGTHLYPGVKIYDNCVIGEDCILHAGAVIGGDGFGFIPGAKHTKIPHVGNVIIHNFVEIGCNTAIDRATLGSTIIGEGTKIDNLVQIGHNVRIGRGCLIASQCGISGSTIVGDYVMMGGQVGLADHMSVGSNVTIAAKSGGYEDMADNCSYGGIPAVSSVKWAKQVVSLSKLPELFKKVASLEKLIDNNRGDKSE